MIECRKPPASGENRERFLLASGLHRQIIQEAVVVNALRKSLNAVFSASLAHVRRGWIQLVEGDHLSSLKSFSPCRGRCSWPIHRLFIFIPQHVAIRLQRGFRLLLLLFV